jgi:hypothetical protein
MIERSVEKPGATISAGKAYDTSDFVDLLKQRRLKAHIVLV